MAEQTLSLAQLVQHVEDCGVVVRHEVHGLGNVGTDYVFPYLIVTLCLRGSARARYDMTEMTQGKNDLGVIMPAHVMSPIDCTPDYMYASLAVSAQLFSDLRTYIFSHDYDKFNTMPICHLTDEQVARLLPIMNILDVIAQHRFGDLEHRRQMLVSQLAIGYEFVNYYRREQDEQWQNNATVRLFSQFSDLVVEHFREEKEVLFYAKQMAIQPKALRHILREATHGVMPKEWIEQYVVTQAKRYIEAHPDQPLKQAAYQLGFSEPSSFYRYFKHATGMTANAYREQFRASRRQPGS